MSRRAGRNSAYRSGSSSLTSDAAVLALGPSGYYTADGSDGSSLRALTGASLTAVGGPYAAPSVRAALGNRLAVPGVYNGALSIGAGAVTLAWVGEWNSGAAESGLVATTVGATTESGELLFRQGGVLTARHGGGGNDANVADSATAEICIAVFQSGAVIRLYRNTTTPTSGSPAVTTAPATSQVTVGAYNPAGSILPNGARHARAAVFPFAANTAQVGAILSAWGAYFGITVS